MGVTFSLREAKPEDGDFLIEMLVEAADWQHTQIDPPKRREMAFAAEKVARYIADWPRPGDWGVIAEDERAQPIGACWLRLFTAQEPAYGFVAADVPELAIGTVKAWRGRGVGRAMLREVVRGAKESGFAQLSLSVDHDNPAVRLYAAEGFVVYESRPTAATMIRPLN